MHYQKILPRLIGKYSLKNSIQLFFVLFFLLIPFSVISQTVSLSVKNVSIKELFSKIEKESDVRFSYMDHVLDGQKNITLSVNNEPIEKVLSKVLENRSLTYTRTGNTIAIKKSVSNVQQQQQQQNDVTGVVSDENGNPLPGVVVSIKGTTTGDVTRADGKYSLDVAVGEMLSYSFIGYKTYEVKVGTEVVINVKLEVEGLTGDEVVVVGFGTTKRSSLTGAISVVTAEQLNGRPVQNVGQSLQGIVPGLNLTSGRGGELNNSLNMNIRGVGTVGSGSESNVLVLIDGMEGDMNTLNPQDIESISILKDAASATIYGSRAPFGAILITTKKGLEGKVRVNYNNNFRFSSPLNLPQIADSESFAHYINDGSINGGGQHYFDEYTLGNLRKYKNGELEWGTEKDPNRPDSWRTEYANNDWYDIVYKDWAFAQEHNASVSGGTEKNQYYISVNYLDQEGAMNYSNDSYDRFSFSAKINAKVTDWARITSTTRFVNTNFDRATFDTDLVYHGIAALWPTHALHFPTNPDFPMSTPNYGQFLPINQMENGGRRSEKRNTLSQQVSLTVEPIKNWNIIAEMNYRMNNDFDTENILPLEYQTPSGAIKTAGWWNSGRKYVHAASNQIHFFNPNIYTNYEKNWDSGHSFKVTAGFQAELNNYRELSAAGDDLITLDNPVLNNTISQPNVKGMYDDWATAGFFGRFNYAYKDKYLLEVSARYDGTSRFLQDQRWNLFPSVSLGWNMKHESFLKDVNAIDMLKIRGSWGQLGNQNTNSSYPFYQVVPIRKDFWWLVNASKPAFYAESPELVSSLLTWETVESWNVGVDFGFLNNRLTGSVDLFNRKTLNMVGPAPTLPEVLGVSVPNVNNADLESKGWELEIGWRDVVQSIGLSYGIRATISDSRQTVTRYSNETGALKNANGTDAWYSGREFGEIWGYTTLGIAQTDEEMSNHIANADQSFNVKWGAGDLMYADLDGDKMVNAGANTLDDHGDLSLIGNSSPRYLYGITLDAAWKGFDFSIFIQGVGKRDYWANANLFWGQYAGPVQTTGLIQHMDYWRPADYAGFHGPNTGAYYPKPYMTNEGAKNQQIQTGYLQDASYARIKNIQFGYTLPSRISEKISLKNVRIFFSADNIATFTNLADMFDPESIDGNGWGVGKMYPMSKVVSFGVNVTL